MGLLSRTSVFIVALLALESLAGYAAWTGSPVESTTRARVERLASRQFDGRRPGSEGERLAAEFLARELASLGARPLPGQASMLSPFKFTAGSRDGGSRLSIAKTSFEFSGVDQVQALSFSDDATDVTGQAVFAGYGIVVPESQGFGYDSYAGLDVKGRMVVVLRYVPEDADPDTKAILARYSDLRYKAGMARERGAAGLIVVTGPRSANAGQTIPMSFDTALAGSGIPAVSVGQKVADVLFAGAKLSLPDAQQALDSGNPHVSGFPLPVPVSLTASVIREQRTARNVVAYLPATAPTTSVARPWIAVGAHFDHLGRGENGNSLASGSEVGRPHVGADDNASGTAAVVRIVANLAKQPDRRRHLLIGLWSAEEIGLVGSNVFTTTPPVPVGELSAYLNYDMVGRMADNKLTVQATGSSPVWTSILERINVSAGFDIVTQADPYQPTDVASFNAAGVPSLSFTTGAHADYHKPSDTADKINYGDLDRIADLGSAIAGRLMTLDDPPAFVKVEQSTQTVSRTGLSIFTGTIPDYASAAKGLSLSGVVGGGPAEQAGLTKGDVIVEIAGHSITNIYDYTYALELLKIGQPAKVIYMRGTERRETTITPAARK